MAASPLTGGGLGRGQGRLGEGRPVGRYQRCGGGRTRQRSHPARRRCGLFSRAQCRLLRGDRLLRGGLASLGVRGGSGRLGRPRKVGLRRRRSVGPRAALGRGGRKQRSWIGVGDRGQHPAVRRMRVMHGQITPMSAGGTPITAPRPSVTATRRSVGLAHKPRSERSRGRTSGTERGSRVSSAAGTPSGLVLVVCIRISSAGSRPDWGASNIPGASENCDSSTVG